MRKYEGNHRNLLGRRIRTLRHLKGWSQQELGHQADLNYKFIGEIERGQQNPSFETLVKIATAFGVDLVELFHFEQEIPDKKEIESRINQILKNITDEELRRVLLILRSLYPIF